jgi:N6-adenosine-specific RNA methylase IME4
MSLDDLARIYVHRITHKNCVLFMWWIASMPEEAVDLAEAWGFKIKTMTGFVWNKTTKTGKPHFGMGHWTRAGAECCLIATRGKISPVSHSVRSVVTAPVLKHSQKPTVVADRIVELCGDLPRIELFARDRKPGWDCWGNEV